MPDSPTVPDHPAFRTFIHEAQRWCALMESEDGMAPADWLQQLHGRLVALYAAASHLPRANRLSEPVEAEPTPAGARSVRYAPMSSEARHGLSRSVAARLGPLDAYVDVSDEGQSDATIIPCSLAYDLSGITQDLRAGLYTWESEGLDAGRWHARFFFEHSWNRYLSGALRALEAHARAGRTAWPAATHGGDAMPTRHD